MIKAYITHKAGKEPFREQHISFATMPMGGGDGTEYNVVVDTKQRFQTHMGFGGAFTEATVAAVSVLSADARKKVIDAYFSQDGLRYNLARLPMHSTDFGTRPRVYVEEGDAELKTFDVSWDEARFDFYKECREVGGELFTLLSTWSPPAFMKSNNELQHGGKLLDEYKKPWAKYYCLFIREMKKRGITIDALTVQNEPEAVQRWESCLYTAEEEAIFIRDYLYPALAENGLADTKIILWDHNRDAVVRRVLSSFAVRGVRDLVWGIGYHWYCCDKSDNLSAVHALCPEKALLLTECCVELAHDSTTGKQSYAGVWEHGERYARQIINDLNHYSQGWIDWNMCLDERGGPTYVENFCEAPIMIDRQSGEIGFMSSYYYIGHFSKFIAPGAVRLYCANDCDNGLYTVAYENPDGGKVVVVENTFGRSRKIRLHVDDRAAECELPAHSIVTLEWKDGGNEA